MQGDRAPAIAEFLAAAGWGAVPPKPLAGDASFRRYYRLVDGERRALLMDAPPPHEDVGSYIRVAEMLRGHGLSAPRIFAEDRERGLLAIEDFGDDTYTRLLADGGAETELYTLAIDTLVALQSAVDAPPDLPPYDEPRLLDEAALLTEWYAPEILGAELPAALREEYLQLWREVLPLAALPGPTLVLRDYHIDNLMLLPGREGVRRCGLLDFQDALCGPASYDLVSLLEDARRDVPAALRAAMTERYLAAFPALDRGAFRRSAAILAAQRNAKIIGIFTRLWRRDGKPQYLVHIPRVWRLLEGDLRDPSLKGIAAWLDRQHQPALRRAPGPAQRGMRAVINPGPKSAMVLAAGRGTRLRPVTETLPKPLVEIAGRTLIDRIIDRLAEAGVEQVVVNLHHLGEAIAARLGERSNPRIELSREPKLLDTGGGVKRALPLLDEAFFAVNGDVLWLDGVATILARLAQAFDPERMDAALVMQRTVWAVGYEGSGDYFLDSLGAPRRRGEREVAPYIYAGIQILHRRLFDGVEDEVFSLKRLYDRAEDAGRLGAIVHDGDWFHVGTPAGLAETRARLADLRIGG